MPKIFRDAVELYYADSCESDEKYFGRRCWIQLLKNCNLGTVSIIGSNPNENPRLVIGLVNMIKRRELLLKTIDQTEVLRNKYAFVMDALIQDITILTLTKNNMLREIFRGQKYMDNNIRNMVKRILEAEDMLHITLLKV